MNLRKRFWNLNSEIWGTKTLKEEKVGGMGMSH
ncbi:hypothetical protein PVL29_012121 [Vitis rotundifolia]|uniref:Uncharacterized protein n=1 Tax=Vitis rotundifolia TaxID=103349 RepID=A0AA38ZQS3_VITRO|nr:hypothetical protein PVL29_012115 [Vitis rotundifolia]KAJ9693237.1 hypothetical protein PVL29_012121 [Vitis rotundifolia]